MSSWKPNRYTSASPYLTVTDANATLEFLVQTFDAQRLRCIERPDGKIMHAEARIDDTVVMISDATEGWPAVPSHVHVYVPDVDATYGLWLSPEPRLAREPEGDRAARSSHRQVET